MEKHILIVDDDVAALTLMQHFFRAFFLHVPVLSVQSGAEAIAVLQQNAQHIGLVLLDLAMPEMDGYEVTRAIRQNLHLHDLPIIILTARSDFELQDRALALGVNEVLTKPFDVKRLRTVIQKYLGLPQ